MSDEALALSFRTGLPYVGLRDHAHDPTLDRIVPPAAARAARAVPLAAEDDRIRLAVADPDADLSPLDRYLTGREVHLALAPREELEAILGPPEESQPSQVEVSEQVAVAELEHEVAADDAQAADAIEPDDAEAAPALAVGTGTEEEAEPEAVAASDADHAFAAEPEPAAAMPQPSDGTSTEEEAEPAAAVPQPSDGTGTEEEAEPELVEATDGDQALAAEPELAAAPEADHALTAEPELAAAEPAPAAATDGAHAVAADAEPEPAAQVDDHPELAGEVPSWLEPPRRGRRVMLVVVIVLFVLAAAAAVVIAFLYA